MAEEYPHSLEQISIADWEATPTSVKRLVSSLLAKDLSKGTIEEINQESYDHKNGRLTQFLDATSIGIAVHNASGDLIYINHAGRDLLTDTNNSINKVDKVEQLPRTFGLYRSTNHQPYPLEELPSYLALVGKKAYVDDLEVHHDDCVIPLEVIAHPIFNPQRQVEYVIATFQDITHRRVTEQALAETRLLYQKVVEAQTDFVLRSHPDTTITFANPSLCCALGRSLKDVIGVKWIDFADPEDLQSTLQKIREMTPENSSFFAENRDQRADGAIGWTQWLNQGIFNSQGELVEIQSVGRDITALKQVELELQSQKELLQLIFDNMPVMAAITSQAGEVLIINQHLEKVLGWTQTDYQTINVLRECYPDPADYEATLKHIQTADSSWMESQTRAKDGQIVNTRWTQLRLIDGRVVSFGLDVTEHKCLINSLAQLNQELELRVAQRTEALQQQEALLREAQRVARLGSWELMVDTGEVLWSPELFQILGYDPNQPAPSLADQRRNFFPEDYQRLSFLIDRAIRFGEPYEVDLQIIREDGSLGYVFAKGKPTLDNDGQLRQLVGIAMDISDRKATEIALAELEAQNQAMLQAIPDLMFGVNRAGVYLSYSGSKELMTSLHDQEIVGQSMIKHLEPSHYQRQVHYMNRALETRQTQVYEQELTIAGKVQQEEVRVVPIEDKEEVLFMIRNISDRKQAEQELLHRRDLQEAIFNESADALFLVDSQTLLTIDCNHRATELFEVADKAELIGIPGHTLQRNPFTPEEIAAINSEMIEKRFWSREIEYVSRQGHYFWGNIAARIIEVAGRSMNLVRVTDITNRKEAEAKIYQAAQQLEMANRELEAFAYSVSHDLRAPLRAIDGFSKALMEDYGDLFDEEAQDYFDRIHRAVERMGDLIDDLLRLSRISRAEMHYSRVNLTTLVQEIANNLQEMEPERRVEFVITPEAIAYADSSLIRVVLENILQNAWKFTSHHPTARIEFGIMSSQTKSPIASPAEIVYFIHDDGSGFDMTYAAMLFGVFQRLHNTNEFPGTGIGLATVQRIIHRHGGQVWAEGIVEAGATIYFTLPNRTRITA